MLHLITGLPGASKTLNSIRELVNEPGYSTRPIYYNNIKLVMLDFEVCDSFSGWFYGVFMNELDKTDYQKYQKIILTVHKDKRFIELTDVPHLEQMFDAWSFNGATKLWLSWVYKVYPSSVTENLTNFLAVNPDATVEQLKVFNLDWRHFDDPTRWHTLPNGSVILIDECQHWFPPRPVGSKAPLHVSEFETHRHKGFDVYLVTQNLKLLDSHVRRLVGRHVHYSNNFGTSKITRYEAESATDFDDYFQRQKSTSKVITRDKKIYGLYHSADVHTHKLRIPAKLYMLAGALVLLVILVISIMVKFTPDDRNPAVSSSMSTVPGEVQTTPTRTGSNTLIYDASSLATFQHPLNARCKEIVYAGYETIKSARSVVRKHYLSCFTGETHSVDTSAPESASIDESDDLEPQRNHSSEKTSRDVEETELISVDRLSLLGYQLRFIKGIPVLAYDGTLFVLKEL